MNEDNKNWKKDTQNDSNNDYKKERWKTFVVNFANLNGDEQEQLMRLINKANAYHDDIVKPTTGERYWFIADDFGVVGTTWENHTSDQILWITGNCYANKASAERFAKIYKKMEEEETKKKYPFLFEVD